jgi:predicted transcriptional regulator
MANTLVTSSIVAKESLAILKNMLTFSASVNRSWESTFTENMSRGYAPGNTIQIKRPPRYTYRAGRVAVPQATVETTVPLTLSQGGCDMSFTSIERTLSLTQLGEKIQAAIAPVATEIDRQGLQLARFSTYNLVNPAGALPTTAANAIAAMTDMQRRLDEMAAPRDRRRALVMNPALNGALIQGFGGFFNSQRTVSEQNRTGMMADNNFGFDMVGMDQSVDVHTNGSQVVTGTAVAAGLSGASIACVGLGGTITRGTIVNFPGVFSVNPQSRQSTGVLADFVITADLAAGAVALPISPAMVTSGAFQNVSNTTTAANFVIRGAASTAYSTNVAFHKDAFTLAMVPMWAPPSGKGVIDVAQETMDGFTVKVTEFYDGVNDNSIMRIDVLFGWAATYPELSVKYYSVA